VQHDPKRAEVAVIYLERALEKMKNDLMQLENTVSSDTSLFDNNSGIDDIENLTENLSIIKRKRLWRF
jgi:16S rRNA G1207 methylase RsmC